MPLRCNSALVVHSSAVIESRLHIWTPGQNFQIKPQRSMRSSSGVWGWVVLFLPFSAQSLCLDMDLLSSNTDAVFCFLHPGQGWHAMLNVSVWLPGVTGHGPASTYWGGRCWSRPRSWPWRSLRSVWGPAGPWGCSPSSAAPGSGSPAPPWRPGRDEKRGR